MIVVAIDGPSGVGKSTVGKALAAGLGVPYLDTGAMYRAMTLWMLEHGVDPRDSETITRWAGHPVITPSTDPDVAGISLNGRDVSRAIRSPEVTAAVSAVSAVPKVRAALVRLQRQVVADALAAGAGVIVEGRDIGTVVLPDADLKVFLVADPTVRAQRRAAEDLARGVTTDVTTTAAALAERDQADSTRVVSPLEQAPDAVVVDGTHDDLDSVIAIVADLVRGVCT